MGFLLDKIGELVGFRQEINDIVEDIKSAESELRDAQTYLERTESEYNRTRKELDKEISDEERVKIQAIFDHEKRKLEKAKLDVENAKGELEELQEKKDNKDKESITSIELPNAGISTISNEIGEFNDLEIFDIYNRELGTNEEKRYTFNDRNTIQKLPDTLKALKSLRVLKLGSHISYPMWELNDISLISYLNEIEELWVCNCNINDIPNTIGKLKKLKVLKLENNLITEIPASIWNMDNLRELHLSGNSIFKLPESVNLPNLTHLILDNNKISLIPNWVWGLRDLIVLNVSNNLIKEIPKIPRVQKKIEEFSASNNRLSSMPKNIHKLELLKKLQLNDNLLGDLGEDICKLNQLEEINISGNQLKNLPQSFTNLINLTSLNLSNNLIKELPSDFSKLFEGLKEAYFSNNKLERIPEGLYDSKLIEIIDISQNDIYDFPEGLSELSNIKEFNFGNKNVKLPDDFNNFLDKNKEALIHLETESLKVMFDRQSKPIISKKQIYISHANNDTEPYLNKFKTALFPYREKAQIWSRDDIAPGDERVLEVKNKIDNADIILLLISPDFISTKYENDEELKEMNLIEEYANEKTIVPITIRKCAWKDTFFEGKSPLPKDGKCLADYTNEDSFWYDVTEGLKNIINPQT